MSVKIMGQVFERYPKGGGEMLLALALADHAHDDGTKVHPRVELLAQKTRQSVRSVQYQLRRMESCGWLIRVGIGHGGRSCSTEYRINAGWINGADIAGFDTEKGEDIAPLPPVDNSINHADSAPIKRVQSAERVQSATEKGATGCTRKEPSGTINGVCGAREPPPVDNSTHVGVRPEVTAAVQLRQRGLRITASHPDLIAACREGVTPADLAAMAAVYPDKPAGYVIAACRRQHAETVSPLPQPGANHGPQNRESQSQRAERDSRRLSSNTARRLAYVWARMTERYGQPWTSVHGTAPSGIGAGEWGEIVSDLTDDELRAGFTADLDRASDYPPSSSRFRAMCKPPRSPQRAWADAHQHTPRARRLETDEQRKHAAQAIGDISRYLRLVPDDAA